MTSTNMCNDTSVVHSMKREHTHKRQGIRRNEEEST